MSIALQEQALPLESGGGGGAVSSVFGRTGAVVAASGDYSLSDITGAQTALDNKVTGPASATDNAIARFDSTTGKLIENSLVTVSDAGVIAGATGLTVTGNISVSGTVDGVDVSVLNTTVSNKADVNFTINSQTGTTYTLVLADAGKLIDMSNAGAISLTIPANASVAFPVGTIITVLQAGAGQVTVGITSDTLNGRNGLKTAGQWSVITLIKRTSTMWVLSGDSTT